MHKIGIDLGGTKTEGILLNQKLEIIERKRLPNTKSVYENNEETKFNKVTGPNPLLVRLIINHLYKNG